MHSHWSLVSFTLLVQATVGNVWCMQITFFFNSVQPDLTYLKYQSFMTLGMLLLGVGVAMAHLGRPLSGFNAVKNIRRSWLSREIMSINLFAGALGLMTLQAFIAPERLNPLVMFAVSLTGGIALFAMTRVYLLRTVPAWNNVRTPLMFLSSALLLGAMLFALYLELTDLIMGIGPGFLQSAISRNIVFAVMSIGIILKISSVPRSPLRDMSTIRLSVRIQPVLQVIGFILYVFSMLPVFKGSNHYSVLLPVAVLCLVTGEVIHRFQFYNDYQRVGL